MDRLKGCFPWPRFPGWLTSFLQRHMCSMPASSVSSKLFQTSHSLLPHLSHGVLFPLLWNSLASWGLLASIYLSTVSWMLCVWAPPIVSKLKIWRIPNPSKIPFGCNKEEPAGWKPTCPHLNSILIVLLGTGSFKTKQTKPQSNPSSK